MEVLIVVLGFLLVIMLLKNHIMKRALKMTVAWLAENGVGAPTDEFRERYTKTIKKRFNLPVDEEE